MSRDKAEVPDLDALARVSLYHRFEQTDGRGYMIITIHQDDVSKGTVLHVNKTSEEAAGILAELRGVERRAVVN